MTSGRNSQELCKDTGSHLLIVEGKDDCHGIYQLAARHGLENTFGIWSGDSDHKAIQRFTGLLLSTEDKPISIGIVLDSDQLDENNFNGLQRRWSQVRSRLEEIGYKVLAAPHAGGTIIAGIDELPRVGIWIMPDNRSDGMFEDFLIKLALPNSTAFARRVVEIVARRKLGTFKEIHKAKAIVHTYLAWQDEPGRPIGIAIKSRMFDASSDEAKPFIEWLRNLFSGPFRP